MTGEEHRKVYHLNADAFLQAVQDVIYWRRDGDSFNCQLLTLMQKADAGNLQRLADAFPALFLAWNTWRKSGGDSEFFDAFKDLLAQWRERN